MELTSTRRRNKVRQREEAANSARPLSWWRGGAAAPTSPLDDGRGPRRSACPASPGGTLRCGPAARPRRGRPVPLRNHDGGGASMPGSLAPGSEPGEDGGGILAARRSAGRPGRLMASCRPSPASCRRTAPPAWQCLQSGSPDGERSPLSLRRHW